MSIILIRGLPGSGKSTLARDLVIAGKADIHLEADMFFINDEGKYVYDGEKIKWAHEWCQSTARILHRNGQRVVVSNTFTRISEMQPYLDVLINSKLYSQAPYIIHCISNFGNVHNVPTEYIYTNFNPFI